MSFFKKLLGKTEEAKQSASSNELAAVLDGVLKPITESEDPVFSEKMMGDGYIIEPTGTTVHSPVNGTIQVVFPTKHAIGILSDAGDDIIIHIGLDTVKLNGEGFETFVEAGDTVVVGQKLLEVDFESIKTKVPSIATPVVVTNIEDRTVNLEHVNEEVTVGTVVATIK